MLAITSIPTLSRFLNPDTFSRLSLLWMASKPVGREKGEGMRKEQVGRSGKGMEKEGDGEGGGGKWEGNEEREEEGEGGR